MNRSRQDPTFDTTDHLGLQLARQLDAQAIALPHEVRERLRVARAQALAAQKQPWPARQLQVQANGSLALTGAGPQRPRLWQWLAALLPLLVLLTAADLLVSQQHDERISDIATIDTQLLSDDIPPAAYADPGFMQFLLEMKRHQERHD